MKKTVALLLVLIMCFSLCSCDVLVYSKALAKADEPMAVKYYNDYYKDDDYKVFLDKLVAFSAELTDKICERYSESENVVISPLSVYMALSLACECATGETRKEILDAVGVTYEEVNNYARRLYGFANLEYKQPNMANIEQTVALQQLTNSIWLDDTVPFKQDGVNKLASEYNCDVFGASFKSGEAGKLINQYIESKSHGLLDGDIQFDTDTYFVLMNTYYLKEIWNEYGDELSFTSESYDFINRHGNTSKTKLLQGYYAGGRAYRAENYSAFYTRTEHSFSIYFFVPDDIGQMSSVFTAENISTVLSINDWGAQDDENKQIHHTRVLFPEFEADFSEDIKEVLSKNFGINKLFDPYECDMSNVTDEDVYCESVIHKAALKVDKTGIEGAAATVLPMCGEAAPGDYEKVYHDFLVDRAFGFVITDSCGTVVFSGIINSIE